MPKFFKNIWLYILKPSSKNAVPPVDGIRLVSVALELNNTEAVKQAVSAGLRVSIVSGFSVINNSGIVCIPIEGLGFYRMFNIILS